MIPEGDIRTDASEKLFQLYNEKNQLVRQVQNTLDKLVKQHDMESILQDRYVTNVKALGVADQERQANQFEGIIHASSQTKQTSSWNRRKSFLTITVYAKSKSTLRRNRTVAHGTESLLGRKLRISKVRANG